MKRNFIKGAAMVGLTTSALLVAPACTKDLDRTPAYDLTAAQVYKDVAGYQAVAAKVYSGFAVTGPNGPDATAGDILGIDQGSSDYIRQYWSAQVLTTDEGVIAWNDPGVQDWHNMNWTSSGVFIRGLYSRIMYEVTLCNAFLAEATDDKLSARGLSDTDKNTVKTLRAEVRFLRALAYYHAMDLYGNVPFVTPTDEIGGTTPPQQIQRAALFAHLESELTAINTDLLAPGQNQYGRVDKAAAWMLLAKMYLNAEVYLGAGKGRYADCQKYADQVIKSNAYGLSTQYANLFRTDNNTKAVDATGRPEIIFPIVFDGKLTQTYGGTTFLTHAAVAGSADANWNPAKYGINGGWGGTRTTSRLFQQFPDTAADSRGKFQTGGQTLDIASQTNFAFGYVPIKYKNVSSTGVAGTDLTFVDTDYPMFRLADAYLMYAEAAIRLNSVTQTAADYVSTVRARAFRSSTAGKVAIADLTLPFMLAERSRELYWEATRRTDLIRFGLFTGNAYTWPWKGGVADGTANVASYRSLFPLPVADLSVNPNLTQNTGY